MHVLFWPASLARSRSHRSAQVVRPPIAATRVSACRSYVQLGQTPEGDAEGWTARPSASRLNITLPELPARDTLCVDDLRDAALQLSDERAQAQGEALRQGEAGMRGTILRLATTSRCSWSCEVDEMPVLTAD